TIKPKKESESAAGRSKDPADFLKQQVSLFKEFSSDRVKQLVAGSRTESFEANQAIAHSGNAATGLWVVLSGTVTASVLGNGGKRQQLGTLKAGDTFGEGALMTGNPLLADFVAESRSEILSIPVSLFQSSIVAEPGAIQHISRTVAERMKMLLKEPAKVSAALHSGDDPYGL